MAKEPKTCFVIAPIGHEGSETRERSDKILKHVVKPVAENLGYVAVRADEIDEPGIITAQVIQHVVDDPMVVADLTGWNPNVFYELALRHTLKMPAVHIIEAGEKIPFDVAGSRTIQVDHRNLDSVEACKDQLSNQIKSVQRDASLVDNPISVSVELQELRQSGNPLEKSTAEIISMLQEVRSLVIQGGRPYPSESLTFQVDEVVVAVRTLRTLLLEAKTTAGEGNGSAHLDAALNVLDGGLARAIDYLAAEVGLGPRVAARREPVRAERDARLLQDRLEEAVKAAQAGRRKE